MLQKGRFMDILCEEPPECFAVTSDYVLWTHRNSHHLYISTRRSRNIQVITEFEPRFNPSLMVVTEDGCLLCSDEAGQVYFFTIDVVQVAPEVDPQAQRPKFVQSDYGASGPSLSLLNHTRGAGSCEKCSAKQRWSLRLGVSEVPSHVSIGADGLLTALSTTTHLILLLRSPEAAEVGGRLHSLRGSSVMSMDGEVSAYAELCANALFNTEHVRTRREGVACSCFTASDRLCVLFADNHLISVQIHLDHTSQLRTSFLRDGHVITQKQVVAMAASSIREGLLVIGLFNASVLVLHAERLELFKILDLQAMLTDHFAKTLLMPGEAASCAGAETKGSDQPLYRNSTTMKQRVRERATALARAHASAVLDIAMTNQQITIATPWSVLHVDTHTLLLRQEGGVDLVAEENSAARHDLETGDADRTTQRAVSKGERRCAPNGSWSAWFEKSFILRYFSSAGWSSEHILSQWPPWAYEQALREEGSNVDVVHAQVPLPAKWLNRLPASRAEAPRPQIRNVKGSNYTEAPWSVQQERKRKLHMKARSCRNGRVPVELELLAYKPLLPYQAHPLVATTASNEVLFGRAQVHQTAVRSNCFTARGEALVTTSGDGSAYYLKLPLSRYRGDGRRLGAHTAAVLSSSVNMSLKTPLVATSAADGVICVWKPTAREGPLLTYRPREASDGASHRATEVRAVRFYYMDKFLCYTSQNRVLLSQYTPGDDLAFAPSSPKMDSKKARRGKTGPDQPESGALVTSPRICDPLFTYTVTEAQTITAMDCINHFVSTLVVLASSNNQIRVLDVVAEGPLRVMNDVHTRHIHHIAMCTGSRFAGNSCSLAAQHLFASTGLDSVTYVWDLRQSHPVRQFSHHKNQALPISGLAFSPDGAMLAVGSEDDAIYVYDVGMGGGGVPMDKLLCRDVPTAIAWHPTSPLMAIGLASGQIMFFNQR